MSDKHKHSGLLQSIPVVGTYADAVLSHMGAFDASPASTQPTQPGQPTQAQIQQGQSIGAVPGQFDPTSIANNALLNGQFSDFAQFGLPTSDQQMLAELGTTSLFVGTTPLTDRLSPGSELPGRPNPGAQAQYKSAADLLKALENMPRDGVIGLQQKLIAGQWLPSSYNPTGIVDAPTEAAYLKVLTTAARYQNAGVQISPDQVLAQSAAGGKGTGTTTTSTVVDLTDPMTARGVANSMFSQLLGRAPTSEDIAGFVQALQGYEQENPGTTTTQTQTNAQGQVVKQKSTEKTGGMGSSLSLRGGDVAAAQEYIDKEHGGEEAQMGIDQLVSAFSQLIGLGAS
jgi:hypothetical protein